MNISSVYGEIYSYVDEEGRLWFVDKISAIPERYRENLNETKVLKTGVTVNKGQQVNEKNTVKPQEYGEPKNTGRQQQANVKNQSAHKKEVTIYVTSWCHFCSQLEDLLKKNNIVYQRVDIEKSESGKREFKKLGGSGVPLIKIDNHIIKGYDPQAILAAYKS